MAVQGDSFATFPRVRKYLTTEGTSGEPEAPSQQYLYRTIVVLTMEIADLLKHSLIIKGRRLNVPCTCGRDRDQNLDRPKSGLDLLITADFRL